jgi:hypothetical protein
MRTVHSDAGPRFPGPGIPGMTTPRLAGRGAVLLLLALAVIAIPTANAVAAAATDKAVSPVLAAFETRIKGYLALKQKAESSLPHLSKDSKPEEVVKHQRALAAHIKEARAGAKPGDFFTPDLEALVKRTLTEVLSGADGKSVKASIMDENPDVPRIALHEQYPTEVPLSTMPPPILASLPQLPKGLEYRFLGTHLVLLDIDADIIIDYTGRVMAP